MVKRLLKSNHQIGFAAIAVLLVLASTVRLGLADEPLMEDVVGAVVRVQSQVPDSARTAGSLGTVRDGNGIVIDDDGLILTIGYLIMESRSLTVTTKGGDPVQASIVAYHNETGFGLLRTEQPLDVKPIAIGSSAGLKEGDVALTIASDGPVPVLPVRVASRRPFAGYWEYLLDRAIYTSPPQPHFGGAALVDRSGRLVGVGSLVVHDASSGPNPSPGNMFVPIDLLKPVFRDLVDTGESQSPARPWLGIYTGERNGRVFVTRVAADGPGQAAGLKAGDIIMGVGGRRISNMADFFRKVWDRGSAGVKVPIDVLAAGSSDLKIQNITVTSQNRYDWLRLGGS